MNLDQMRESNNCKIYVAQMVILFLLIVGASVMLVLDPNNSTYYTSIISLIIGVLVPNPDHGSLKF